MFLNFPSDQDRSSQLGYVPKTIRKHLEIPANASTELLIHLLASWSALVFRYTEQENIGFHLFLGPGQSNPQGIQISCQHELTIDQVASKIKTSLAQAPNQVETANIAVTYQSGDQPESEPGDALSYELHAHCIFRDQTLHFSLYYNSLLFTDKSVESLLDSWLSIFIDYPKLVTSQIQNLPLINNDMQQELSHSWDRLPPPAFTDNLIEHLTGISKTYSDQIAVSFQGSRLSYENLRRQSNNLALHFRDLGIPSGSVVAVCLSPCPDILTSMLAIFKTANIYLPIDPTHPDAFIRQILDEADPKLVILTNDLAERSCFQELAQFQMEEIHDLPNSQDDLISAPSDQSPAYYLYTSGTTGNPKAVVGTYGNLIHYLQAAMDMYRFRPEDVFGSIAPFTFSISFFSLLTPLCMGAKVEIMARHEVLDPKLFSVALKRWTVVHAGPSLLTTLMTYLKNEKRDSESNFPNIRHASTGGDIVAGSVMEGMKLIFPNAELFVIYGSTEISCMGTTYPVPRGKVIARSMVGQAFPGVKLRLVDSKRNLVPYGVVGEICFAGPGLSPGYLHRDELNSEKFFEMNQDRYFSMGDLGRLHRSGELEILGRRDYQVQIRGIRVELVGIENRIKDLGLASHCALRFDKASEQLIAYLVEPRVDSLSQLRQKLKAALPEYMLPQRMHVLESMPLTRNGKLDRQQLASFDSQAKQTNLGSASLLSPTEQQIAAIFSNLLQCPINRADADFFENGGHSLLAVLAVHEISQRFEKQLSSQKFFEKPTVEAIAKAIEQDCGSEELPIPLNNCRNGPMLFMLSGIHVYRSLAEALEAQFACFGVYSGIEIKRMEPGKKPYTVEELAAEYMTMIEKLQSTGPYYLLGYSFAGIIAFELARQLKAKGQEIAHLILIDPILPEWANHARYRLRQIKRIVASNPKDVLSFAFRRMKEKWKPQKIGIARYGHEAELGALEAKRDELNSAAAVDYLGRIQCYNSKVSLFVSGKRLRSDPLKSRTCGWDAFIEDLSVHTIEADHYSMIEAINHTMQIASLIHTEQSDP